MPTIDRTRFRVYRGTEADIHNIPITDGYLYFAIDSKRIYTDYQGERQAMGGAGGGGNNGTVALWYISQGVVDPINNEEDDDNLLRYILEKRYLDDSSAVVTINDLLINTDGAFYKVLDYTEDENFFCSRIAISGTGGGGSSGPTQDLILEYNNIDLLGATYIYGQSNIITFTPSSLVDPFVSMQITIHDNTGVNADIVRTQRLYNGDNYELNANIFPKSDNLEMTVLINSPSSTYNRGRGYSLSFAPIRVLDMYLTKPADFTLGVQNTTAALRYIPFFDGLGGENSRVRINAALDGSDEIYRSEQLVSANSRYPRDIEIDHQDHGMHTVELWLSVMINDEEYRSSSVVYEVPFIDAGNESPIIWIKNELGTIINYEPAVLQYMVYSSVAEQQGTTTEVSLYRGSELLNSEEVTYNGSNWWNLDLTPYYEFTEDGVRTNNFTLMCGGASKNIEFQVSDIGARDLSLRYGNRIEMNFDSLGRSNKEIRANRSRWTSKVNDYEATLTNFNWYSNGWQNDNDDMGAYLSVANGASVSFPLILKGNELAMTMNTSDRPWSFEVRFRVRNAKKFATLVTEIPKYKYTQVINGVEVECAAGEEKTLDEIAALNPPGQVKLDEDGNMEMNESNTTKKVVQSEKYIAMRFLNANKEGFAIGTQEAYFNTSGATVNVKYKEDEIINITFVVDKQKNQLSIYLNGILSGVGNLSGTSPISMDSTCRFEINSEYCDFDLYKFRVYPLALTMPDVIHNYIADIKNIAIYDENQLTDVNDPTALSYQALVDYNETHPDTPTMPYAVIDMTKTSEGPDLPHAKGNSRKCRIEFTNPVADYLYASGQITAYQYYTHCPSYTADDVDIDVQGTSSQKYPRRNFKTKFKKAKNWNFSLEDGELFGKSVAGKNTLTTGQTISKKWHMDSEKLGTNKFTWKIDYMESSGSYNTGFANLMGTGIYPKHPLEDLHIEGLDASIYRTSVYGFPLLVFHKTAENTYTYIGRYNINLDKGSNEYYGFEEEIEQPYITATREVPQVDENGEPIMENDEPVTVTETYHPLIADVAECWELRDNQGTWCSWRYPTSDMRAAGFHSLMHGASASDPRLEVAWHFEARYHKYADQFEYAQNILLGKNNVDDFSADIGGSNTTAASSYVYNKLTNLEVLFNWLDSTDTRNATDLPFEANREYRVSAKLTKTVPNPNFTPHLKPKDAGYQPEFIEIEDTEKMAEQGVTYDVRTENGVEFTYGIFTKDSVEYRRQKFYAEFSDHLDLDYCAIYFVMTELLLCYDSRGKNMMIATFGPQKPGGDYIWYPIFYDIDTQLGLNNVGAKLWDYDENNSENGTFSTKDSVLWNNLYDVYYNKVVSTYRNLRLGKITETTIENSYLATAGTTFDSYAMQGKRPIIAIGLDEYYKYVLPVTKPWKDQEGNMVTANYLYACQGDRILSRALLIENRLLYMDSKWLSGGFTITTGGMSGIMFRGTGNKPQNSSDKFLDGKRWDNDSGTYVIDETVHYPVPYFDATPDYKVTPYLNFYVTTFIDEMTFQTSEAYSEAKYPDGIPTPVSPTVVEQYKNGAPDQQLNYFAASKYISSLGDLSVKYVNQVDMPNCPRLLDIKLGNDAPGYYNGETLDPFNLDAEVDDATGQVKSGHEKSLLQFVNLTNVSKIGTNDSTRKIDLRAADKLQEFRALGTQLTYVQFADGAPLTTVHLPSSTSRILFTQNKNLTKLITSTPTVIDMDVWNETGVVQYRPHEEYEGLFIDSVTNYNAEVQHGNGSTVTEISIEGDNLGYGSYQILNNVVDAKVNTGSRLKIRMAEINWTPYVQVEYGEAKDTVTPNKYFYLTEHSTYEPYTRLDEYWLEDTLNGRVYTYDNTKDESIIPDLSLLDIFLMDYRNSGNTMNQFTNNIESMDGQKTYPTITGEMYVSNAAGDAIRESDLTDVYGAAWPNLKIRVANVDPAYVAKYIQRLDSGKDNEIDVIRYARGENVHPTATAKIPTRANYDFEGWALEPQYAIVSKDDVQSLKEQNKIYTNEAVSNLTFSDSNDVFVFYAVFSIMTYKISFRDPYDDHELASYYANFGEKLHEPDVLPTTNKSDLEMEEIYKFIGWVATAEEGFPRTVIAAKTIDVTKVTSQYIERVYYAAFIKASVYDNPTPAKYFKQESGLQPYTDPYPADGNYDIPQGYILKPVAPNVLQGKITIPSTFNGMPVYSLAGFGDQPGITHVFFENNGENIRRFENSCFNANDAGYVSHLQWVQWPATTRYIGDGAFYGCTELILNESFNNMRLRLLGGGAFNQAIGHIQEGMTTLHFAGCLRGTGQHSLAYLTLYRDATEAAKLNNMDVVFGGKGDPSLFELTKTGIGYLFLHQNNCKFKSMTIYCDANRYTELSGLNASNQKLWYAWVNQYQGYFISYDGADYKIDNCTVLQA